MQTPLIDRDASHSGDPVPTEPMRTALDSRRRRNWKLLGGVAAAAAVAVGSAAIVGNVGGDGSGEIAEGPPLELSLGRGDALASCLAFDVAILADMSPAFAGTATAADGESVTLAVDRWYAGGDAATVVLQGAAGSPALIDGFEFRAGERYLITASDGNVNFCGYSGIATPELTAAFDAAFAS